MSPSWLLLQLADGSFPSGAFAHSGGLEAASVLDGPVDVGAFVDQSLRQAGRAALPFVRAAALDPGRLDELDEACDVTLALEHPNHASRAQGRALASAASRVWEETLGSIGRYAATHPAHHAPIFGAISGTLGLGVEEALGAYLHGAMRGLLSAGVRLGLVGPLEAQRLIADRAALLDDVLAATRGLGPEDAAQTAPLLEIFGALHDRLDGRMFQS